MESVLATALFVQVTWMVELGELSRVVFWDGESNLRRFEARVGSILLDR